MKFKVTYKMHGKEYTEEVWAGSQKQAEQIAFNMFGDCVLSVENLDNMIYKL